MKKRKTVRRVEKDPKKERAFKVLAEILEKAGYQVRREKLGAGNGWRVLSGSCRLQEESLIFIDRRMTQEDQIAFLVSKLLDLQIKIPSGRSSELPNNLVQTLGIEGFVDPQETSRENSEPRELGGLGAMAVSG